MDKDEKEIKESLEDLEKKEEISMSEAPASTTIRAYYQGFSVLFTKRNPEGKISPMNTRVFIDDIIKKGYKPSWNDDTNNANGKPQEQAKVTNCGKCGAERVLNPKTGKWFCKEKCWLKK